MIFKKAENRRQEKNIENTDNTLNVSCASSTYNNSSTPNTCLKP
jgi:hypothetical protein